jgi:uncharacterized protein (TIGR01244 family)
MDLRPLTPRYHVAPQLTPADMPAIAAAGYTMVICNRPDNEVPPELQADALRRAALAAGLRFELLALDQQTLTPENAAHQRDLIAGADGKVLAYCRTGTRCSVIWGMGQAAALTVPGVLQQAAAAGYQLDGYRPLFEFCAANGV